MKAPSSEEALWPREVARLQAAIRGTPSGPARDLLRGALWRLLFEALFRCLTLQSRGARHADRADLEDIASEKALEILSRAESGAWDSSGRSAAEISGYISTAARYGWIDHVQRSSREIPTSEEDESVLPVDAHLATATATAAPTSRAEAAELALAVRECAEALPARERRVWFYRAYYDMSSREIAEHPQVQLKAPHVDVLAQRARAALRNCLEAKGHAAGDPPPGAFVDLWEALESMAEQDSIENSPREI